MHKRMVGSVKTWVDLSEKFLWVSQKDSRVQILQTSRMLEME